MYVSVFSFSFSSSSFHSPPFTSSTLFLYLRFGVCLFLHPYLPTYNPPSKPKAEKELTRPQILFSSLFFSPSTSGLVSSRSINLSIYQTLNNQTVKYSPPNPSNRLQLAPIGFNASIDLWVLNQTPHFCVGALAESIDRFSRLRRTPTSDLGPRFSVWSPKNPISDISSGPMDIVRPSLTLTLTSTSTSVRPPIHPRSRSTKSTKSDPPRSHSHSRSQTGSTTIFSFPLSLSSSTFLHDPRNLNPESPHRPTLIDLDHTHVDPDPDPVSHDPFDHVQKAIEIVGKAIEADTKGEYAVSLGDPL
jgi:hypothetical protein